DERRGSSFNPYEAKYFDRFIVNSGLIDVTLEGFAFTWSHPSGLKMRCLWDYISTVIGRWNGESIVMGNLNEVRTSDEHRGSSFNPYEAKYFD
nr:RNA-directed DNA polymerase, eukaryota [Tanacetum cinerariifolium]